MNPASVQSGVPARLEGPELASFHGTQRQVQAWLSRIQPMQELAMAAD